MKLQLKRSNVLESGEAKSPTSAQLDYGELAVNYNNGDPAVFLKDSNDNVIRIAGKGATGLDGDYVNVDGDNMTGNLTFGTDKITLNADGSGSFAGRIAAGSSDNGVTFTNSYAITAYSSSALTPTVWARNSTAGGPVFTAVDGAGNFNATIKEDGSAEFSGKVISGGNPASGTAMGSRLNETGTIQAARPSGMLWSGFAVGNSTPTSVINSDGSAQYKGSVTVGNSWGSNLSHLISNSGQWIVRNDTASQEVFGIYQYGSATSASTVSIRSDGSGSFAGDIYVGESVASTTQAGSYVGSSGQFVVNNAGSTPTTDRVFLGKHKNVTTSEIFANGSAVFNGSVNAASFSGDGSGLTGLNIPVIQDGTTSQKGIVQLSTSISSTSSSLAATSSAVKSAYDRGTSGLSAAGTAQARADTAVSNAAAAQTTANNALPKTGGTITGNLTVNGSLSGDIRIDSLPTLP